MSKTDTLVACLLSAALVAILVPLARVGVDPHHDGIMLKPALDVLSGQILFRDTFMQYGALTCYLQVLALWIYPALLSIKFMTVAVYAITMFFLYAVWRMLLPTLLTAFACGLYALFIPFYEAGWTMIPWSSEFAMMFQVIALYALGLVITGKNSMGWALVLGLSTACVFWCRQSVGIVMWAAFPVIWIVLLQTGWGWSRAVSRRAILMPMALGFISVNAFLLGGISLSGALPNWWYQNFVWPKHWAFEGVDNWSIGAPVYIHLSGGLTLLALLLILAAPNFINRIKPVFSRGWQAIYFAVLVGILLVIHDRLLPLFVWPEGGWSTVIPLTIAIQAIAVIAWAWHKKYARSDPKDYLLIAFSGIAIASLTQYYPVPCTRHIFWSLAPGFGLFVHLTWKWSGWRPVVVFFVLSAAFAPLISFKIREAGAKLSQPLTTLTAPAVLKGMRVKPEQARVYESINTTLRPLLERAPMTPSALLGPDALYLCFTPNRSNPSPYFVQWKGLQDDQSASEKWARIIQTRPILFIQNQRKELVDQFYAEERYTRLLFVTSRESSLALAAPIELVTQPSENRAPAK